jgi:hypothetical protein
MSIAAILSCVFAASPPTGFRPSAWFGEFVREQCWNDGVRVVVNVPPDFSTNKPTLLVLFATPNGNTIEQTLGCAKAEGVDWHFDIQHIAAQVRRLRETTTDRNIVLACLEAEGLSWPAWKRKQTNGPSRVKEIVQQIKGWIPDGDVRLALAAHSGGGSFLFGFLDAAEAIPNDVERVVFLDANYSYSDADKHGDKLLVWLNGDQRRRLVVIAYDDREITLNGKRVVGPDGGTFRAADRMHQRFARDVAFQTSNAQDFVIRTALDGRLALLVHSNPQNRILHTVLVGEMNGLLRGLTDPDRPPEWVKFGDPRAYTRWVQPAPIIPPRPRDAVGGVAFIQSVAKLTPTEREEAIAREILRGNIPNFLRAFKPIAVSAKDSAGKEHTIRYDVAPDYLAIGSDADFVRMPMTPATAARIADAFGCALPTRKIVDDVYRNAALKLAPKPLTMDREAPATFLRHHRLIEEQRAGHPLGELIAGIKKDVVVTNRLAEKPNRVAIYGWHTSEGKPIQPLTIVHVDRYVDYSHGVRLMKRTVVVDGIARDVRQVLLSPDRCVLLSDEGPILRPTY